jgi:hypothetical protein
VLWQEDKDMSKDKKYYNKVRHSFLLETFFPENKDEYEEKQVGDYWLIKQKNNENDTWLVAIYTKESFKNKLF